MTLANRLMFVCLFDNLAQGFPLVGKLPRSGTLPLVEYEGTYSMDLTPVTIKCTRRESPFRKMLVGTLE